MPAGLLLLALAAAGCAPPASSPPGTEPLASPARELLPDCGGAIDLAVMTVSSPRRSGLRNQELVRGVVLRLGPEGRFLILANPEMILDPNPAPGRMEFVEIPDGLDFSIWPQDPFVVLEGAEGPILLTSRIYQRADDRKMAATIAGAFGARVRESSLYFAGGNLLADERHAFVGADLIRDNVADLALSPDEVVRRFQEELGRKVLVVGESPQPVAHLDMVLTPLGDGRVAVADSGRGAGIVAEELARQPESIAAFEREAMANFFGHPDLESVVDEQGYVHRPPPIEGVTAQAIEDSRAVAAALDGIAGDLERRGYDVVRVPVLMTRRGAADDPRFPRGAAGYPMLSYDNVIVERINGRDRVYLARYGLAPLDIAAQEAWRDAGFEVHPIDGLTTSSMYRGSLRCVVKVLGRKYQL